MSTRCQNPWTRENPKYGGAQTLPCGRCENCKKRYMSNWSFRLMQEHKVSTTSYFLTLTYAPDNTRITKNGFMDLSKRDLQLFIKRLRESHDRHGVHTKPIKYFAVGEYGGRFKRPHFHVILFNAELSEIIPAKYATATRSRLIQLDGKQPYDCVHWPHGHCTVGEVNEASVGYCLIYTVKPSRVPEHRNDDRQREFGLMSKGLGANYLTQQMVNWHMQDLEGRQLVQLADGKKASLPRYYRERMFNERTQLDLATLNMFNLLYELDEVDTKEKLTSRERSEAYYAGLTRMYISYNQSQKTF